MCSVLLNESYAGHRQMKIWQMQKWMTQKKNVTILYGINDSESELVVKDMDLPI
jgi:hypothetical protein